MSQTIMSDELDAALRWCEHVLGPVVVIADHTREHPGLRAGVRRLRAATGEYCVKTHHDPAHWAGETHGYERWAPVFGAHAPRLIAVRDEAPLALIVSALPGRVLEGQVLPIEQQRAVWRAAGAALAQLHAINGNAFGPCRRDGVCNGVPINDACAYVSAEFDSWLARGARLNCLSAEELSIVRHVRELIPAFAGERPTACHRDYCSANWLVTDAGDWSGVIDFEFAYWDVRAADVSRYPEWEWIGRPELAAAFDEGYATVRAPVDATQRLVARALYALSAVVWGRESGYRGFEREGRAALQWLRDSHTPHDRG